MTSQAIFAALCEKTNERAVQLARDNPANGLYYIKAMKSSWRSVDDQILVHEDLLAALLRVNQSPNRLDVENALRRFNALQGSGVFVEDEHAINSFRTQAGGLKLMLSRIGKKARNMKNGGRTHPSLMKIIEVYKQATPPNPGKSSSSSNTLSPDCSLPFFFLCV